MIFRSRPFDRNENKRWTRDEQESREERKREIDRQVRMAFLTLVIPPAVAPPSPRAEDEEGLRAFVHHADQARTVDLDFVVVV
jgi:hypothetical protein